MYLFEEELLGKGKYVFFSSEISPSFYSSISNIKDIYQFFTRYHLGVDTAVKMT